MKGNFGNLLTVKSYHAQTDCAAGESGIHCNCPPVGAVCDRSHCIPRVECDDADLIKVNTTNSAYDPSPDCNDSSSSEEEE